MKNKLRNLMRMCVIITCVSIFSFAHAAIEPPDALVKRLSNEVLEIAKVDKDVRAGNRKRILELVESKILPYVDFQRMTAMAVGRSWREATPEQKKMLTTEFRSLLIYTYSGAISQIKDQQIEFRPFRSSPNDTEVEVRSQVIQPQGGEPIQLNYRLEKMADGWLIYDMNVLGAWLIETYKGNFAAEINKSGIDGLIKVLSDRNKRLSNSMLKTPIKPAS